MIGSFWALMILSVTNGLMLLTSYISNNTFPQPLSEGEEAEYITRLNRGDSEARKVLTEHNLRLVAHIVKKFDGSGEDTDDLISIGTIGLIKAIDTYCPDKGTRLATYAARCIENEMLLTIPSGSYFLKYLLCQAPEPLLQQLFRRSAGRSLPAVPGPIWKPGPPRLSPGPFSPENRGYPALKELHGPAL